VNEEFAPPTTMLKTIFSKFPPAFPTLPSEDGQTLTEYAVILVLVAVLAVGSLSAIGVRVEELIGQAAEALGG
jgi:Flp pilus assembly pilin Flp